MNITIEKTNQDIDKLKTATSEIFDVLTAVLHRDSPQKGNHFATIGIEIWQALRFVLKNKSEIASEIEDIDEAEAIEYLLFIETEVKKLTGKGLSDSIIEKIKTYANEKAKTESPKENKPKP